jgi:transposase
MSGRFWLTVEQVARLRRHGPQAQGKPRVEGRRVLGGIRHLLRNGLKGQDAPGPYGPRKTRLTAALPVALALGCSPGSSVTWPGLAGTATPS